MHLTTPSRLEGGVHTSLDPRRLRWALPVVTAALLLVFELDHRTGSAPIQHLYYVPILLAAVSFRMRGGVTAAVAAVLLYHLANPHLLTFRYEESDIVQIALFIAIGAVTAKLTRDAHRLHALAMTDDLTGLHNLRSFEQRLRALMRQSRETTTPVSMLVVDVDRLKSLNDTHGHLAGADAVRTVGHILHACLPQEAFACRYGGDEFAVALPGCGQAHATRIADDLRRAVHAESPVLASLRFPAATLTISVGLASRTPDPRARRSAADDDASGEALFRAADAALYRAKASGRNHVSVA